VHESGWYWGSGLSYQQTWTKFRYEKESIDHRSMDNIITRILIDNETQDTTGILRGDVSVQEMSSRNLQHYNQFQSIGVPVHIGYIRERTSFMYGLELGANFSYMLRQEGRLLLADETVFDFGDSDYFKPWRLNIYLRPMVAIPLRDGLHLSCSPIVSMSVNNELSVNRGLQQSSFNYGLSLGVYKVFD